MTKRQEFTKRTKAAVFTREDGRCERCTRKVGIGGEPAEFHHRVTCEDGGDSSAENCELLCKGCHSHQTHKVEAPAKAEGRRHTLKRAGVKAKTRSAFQTSRDGPFKAKIGGGVERR